jgi:hypothetical protein
MFVIPVSTLIGQKITFKNSLITFEEFKIDDIKNLKLSVNDIENSSKVGPAELDNSNLLELNLLNKCLLFNNFYNGELKIIGNTWYFIDDINNNFEFFETELYANSLNAYIRKQKIDIGEASPSAATKLITIKSTGANGSGATLAIDNIIGITELFNLNIENTITVDDINSGISLSGSVFVETGNILSELYLSENLDVYYNPGINLFNTEQLTGINLPEFTTENISELLTFKNKLNEPYDINYLNINTHTDDRQGIKVSNNIIQDILYNNLPNYNMPNISLVVWAKDNADINTFTPGFSNPLFSDYSNDNSNEQQNKGIMFGPYGVYAHNFDSEYQNVAFESDYSKELKHIVNGKWVMYVFEFQHADSNLSASAASDFAYDNIYSKTAAVLPTGKMRINIFAYYTEKTGTSEFTFNKKLLLPTKAMINNASLLQQYAFPVLTQPYNPLFIGSCPIHEYISNMLNWYSWNGGIRNIMLFNKFLTDSEIEILYKTGIRNRYNWNYDGENSDLETIAKNKTISIAKFNNLTNMNVTYCKSTQALSEFTKDLEEKFFVV